MYAEEDLSNLVKSTHHHHHQGVGCIYGGDKEFQMTS